MELIRADSCCSCFPYCLLQQLFDMSKAVLAKKLAISASNEASLSLHRIDEASIFKVGVSSFRGDHADTKVISESTDRGERLPFSKLTCEDRVLDL